MCFQGKIVMIIFSLKTQRGRNGFLALSIVCRAEWLQQAPQRQEFFPVSRCYNNNNDWRQLHPICTYAATESAHTWLHFALNSRHIKRFKMLAVNMPFIMKSWYPQILVGLQYIFHNIGWNCWYTHEPRIVCNFQRHFWDTSIVLLRSNSYFSHFVRRN